LPSSIKYSSVCPESLINSTHVPSPMVFAAFAGSMMLCSPKRFLAMPVLACCWYSAMALTINWRPARTPTAAGATIYSLIETAKANGLEPFAYLRHVFEQLPATRTGESRRLLLPWNVNQTAPTIPAGPPTNPPSEHHPIWTKERLAANGRAPVTGHGRTVGLVPVAAGCVPIPDPVPRLPTKSAHLALDAVPRALTIV